MAKKTGKAFRFILIRALLNFVGGIVLLAMLPVFLVLGVIGLLFTGVVKLLEATGLKNPSPHIPFQPSAIRPEPWKPTQRFHRAWSTRAQLLRHHNKRVKEKPYALARGIKDQATGENFYFDGRVGENPERIARYGVPRLQTPEDIAAWLNIPLRTLAWLGDYHRMNAIEKVRKKQHYHYTWIKKRSGGERLIEAPKPILKTIQQRILREILDRVPAHPAAHGFVKGRSIRSNAAPHTQKYVVLKADLANFYPNVRYKRVVAIFGGMGYNLEASHWLARLCTNRIPEGMKTPQYESFYFERHLPQGAPTSPALANLAAFALDVRLSGLAKKFGVAYTRYADDLTFSGGEQILAGKSMNWLIRYIRGIVRDEKFTWNNRKKKIVRCGHRQSVTGLTVNQKPNISRKTFDTLKATLNNCARKGPASQNRDKRENFRAHLQGRIAFVASVNKEKAVRLQKIFETIKWT